MSTKTILARRFSNGKTLAEYMDALLLPESCIEEQVAAWRRLRPQWSDEKIAEEIVDAWEAVFRDFGAVLSAYKSRPRTVGEPRRKTIPCRECGVGIAYLPEDIEEHHGHDYSGGADGFRRVKCPRPRCNGHGYIEVW